MSFTGMLTYWLVVGLYQSIHFYQAAMERQTRAAQLEAQLSHAELENLKSQLHPHFLFNSLHTIGILMQEDVDAASRLLVCLGARSGGTINARETKPVAALCRGAGVSVRTGLSNHLSQLHSE
jgi:hypothetical protein